MKITYPFFIAEISANHCGKISLAKKLMKLAKNSNASAVKLQTFKTDLMTLNSNNKYFKIKSGLWKNYKLWDLYNKAKTPFEWHKELFQYGKKIGIKVFSSVFDEVSLNLLEKLNCPIYKISSFELTDLYLIKKVASTRKPIIISTGTGSLDEIEEAYECAKKNGAREVILLYCVSNYPSKANDFNLNNIKEMKKKFNCKVGFSDHSTDETITLSAVAAGAQIIEKHIALENQKSGLDIQFALKGKKIKDLINKINFTYKILGNDKFERKKSENFSKKFRRSLFAINNIDKGDFFTKENLGRIRPGYGISCKYYEKILGKRSPVVIKIGHPLSNEILRKLKL